MLAWLSLAKIMLRRKRFFALSSSLSVDALADDAGDLGIDGGFDGFELGRAARRAIDDEAALVELRSVEIGAGGGGYAGFDDERLVDAAANAAAQDLRQQIERLGLARPGCRVGGRQP